MTERAGCVVAILARRGSGPASAQVLLRGASILMFARVAQEGPYGSVRQSGMLTA